MALNPFFLQGSPEEQNLVQSLVNEQLKIYGVEVTYIPRKFVNRSTVFQEVEASKFDDNFQLEAYVNTWDGYSGAGDVLTKFGMSLRDELQLVISRERFEDFIAPFLDQEDEDEIGLATMRPREGDLVFFPLGNRLFEVKFVEHEVPFYQLGHTYVYELQCELFEYNDESIDTGIDAIDSKTEDIGTVTDLQMHSSGSIATATATIGTGFVRKITLINDGSGYVTAPAVEISPPASGIPATAVAITTSRGGVKSLKEIRILNPGSGYDANNPPLIILNGGGGAGAAVTFGIVNSGISTITITNRGDGYAVAPTITFTGTTGVGGTTATAETVINDDGKIDSVQFVNVGSGYTVAPTVAFAGISTTGVGTYLYNEVVTGSLSGTTARVRNFKKRVDIDNVNPPVELQVSLNSGKFNAGEVIVGSISSARYVVESYSDDSFEEPFDSNKEIESEAFNLLDFAEDNPFGDY